MERLQKFLSRAGVASRRHAETMITDGRVKVNGKVVTELGTRVDAAKDLVLLDGKLVSVNSERKYFLLYKPPGVVTTLSDPEGRPTVADYAQDTGGRVFPVGRLDYDAEGALLLTDDGDLANKLMHPSHQVPRVYLAKVKGMPDEPSLQKLVAGVRLEDGMAHAVEARIFNKAEKNTWVKLVVTEGRQHLVKRLCAAIGHPVVRLFRPAHAGISVHGLSPGALRALTNDEIRRVKAAADGTTSEQPALYLPARRHGHAAPGFEPEEGAAPSREQPEANEPEDVFIADSAGSEPAPRPARTFGGGDRPRRKESRLGGGSRGDDARGGGRSPPRAGGPEARSGRFGRDGERAPRGGDEARRFPPRTSGADSRTGSRFGSPRGEGPRGGEPRGEGRFAPRGEGARGGEGSRGEGRFAPRGEGARGGRFGARGGDSRGEGRSAPRREGARGGDGGGRFGARSERDGGSESRGGGRFGPRGGGDGPRSGGRSFESRDGGGARGGRKFESRDGARSSGPGRGPRDGGGEGRKFGGGGRFGERSGEGRSGPGEGGRKFGGPRGGGRFGKPGGKFSSGRKPGPRGSGGRSSPRKPRGSW